MAVLDKVRVDHLAGRIRARSLPSPRSRGSGGSGTGTRGNCGRFFARAKRASSRTWQHIHEVAEITRVEPPDLAYVNSKYAPGTSSSNAPKSSRTTSIASLWRSYRWTIRIWTVPPASTHAMTRVICSGKRKRETRIPTFLITSSAASLPGGSWRRGPPSLGSGPLFGASAAGPRPGPGSAGRSRFSVAIPGRADSSRNKRSLARLAWGVRMRAICARRPGAGLLPPPVPAWHDLAAW